MCTKCGWTHRWATIIAGESKWTTNTVSFRVRQWGRQTDRIDHIRVKPISGEREEGREGDKSPFTEVKIWTKYYGTATTTHCTLSNLGPLLLLPPPPPHLFACWPNPIQREREREARWNVHRTVPSAVHSCKLTLISINMAWLSSAQMGQTRI